MIRISQRFCRLLVFYGAAKYRVHLLWRVQASRSNGLVNAEGPRTLDTLATRTRIVRMYGIITAISEGMGIPSTWIHNCRELIMLNNNAPPSTPHGRHAPKYTRATAIKPSPLVIFCWKTFSRAMDRDAPAIPESVPPRMIVKYLMRATLTPSESAASGFSPTERIFNPRVVLLRTNQARGTRR